jgi:adenosylmethionine-8-amino-7-oxononanoate aminotransferase
MMKNITLDIVKKEIDSVWSDNSIMKIENTNKLWLGYTQMSDFHNNLIITKGNGALVKDSNSNIYIDGQGGVWCVNIGHNNPEIIYEIWKQTTNISYYTLFGSSHIPGIKLSEKLVEVTPPGLNHVFYGSGGGDAVEIAINITLNYWYNQGKRGKRKILIFESGYHGDIIGYPTSEVEKNIEYGYLKKNEDLIRLPYPSTEDFKNDLSFYFKSIDDIIKKIGNENIGALIYEPIQGVGGCIVPSQLFYNKLQDLVKKNEILQIVDEVSTGFGRTGNLFAINHYNILPDILVLSKGLSSAYLPLSAIIVNENIYNSFLEENKHFKYGYTLAGQPIACAAALKNIELLTRGDFLFEVVEKGNYLKEKLNNIKEEFDLVKEINGIGLMNFIHLIDKNKMDMSQIESRKICKIARGKGLLIRSLDNLIPLMPPLCITIKQIDIMCDIISYSLNNYRE